tara:strand:- start:115 stop:243 length:129 start_codon:yes stop_codon:yes gene_type:complete
MIHRDFSLIFTVLNSSWKKRSIKEKLGKPKIISFKKGKAPER